jgi:hypothetical protein
MTRSDRSIGLGNAFLLSAWACALGAVIGNVFL